MAGVLWVTATLKAISVLQGDPILRWRDPVFQIRNRDLLLLVAGVEWGVAAYAVWGRRLWWKVTLLHALATSWLAYRGLLWMSGFKGYNCPCLGPMVRDLPFQEGAWSELLGVVAGATFLMASLLLVARASLGAPDSAESSPTGNRAGG
ncbi:MAG: hypothetical protein D6766_05245 [Verrucomicrobia bacterium]|nr:MAG: hypothetical protein D6766_05245 [Verrucomicrobiota bacterium]